MQYVGCNSAKVKVTKWKIPKLLYGMQTCKLTFVEPGLASAFCCLLGWAGGVVREAAAPHCPVVLASEVPAAVILWRVAPWFMKIK